MTIENTFFIEYGELFYKVDILKDSPKRKFKRYKYFEVRLGRATNTISGDYGNEHLAKVLLKTVVKNVDPNIDKVHSCRFRKVNKNDVYKTPRR